MSDIFLRELERQAAQGDSEAVALLVRYLERAGDEARLVRYLESAGDQTRLCALGYHDVDASQPGYVYVDRGTLDTFAQWSGWVRWPVLVSGAPPRTYVTSDPCSPGAPRAVWCESCSSAVPVLWVRYLKNDVEFFSGDLSLPPRVRIAKVTFFGRSAVTAAKVAVEAGDSEADVGHAAFAAVRGRGRGVTAIGEDMGWRRAIGEDMGWRRAIGAPYPLPT